MNYNVPRLKSLAELRASAGSILVANLAGWQVDQQPFELPPEAKGFFLAAAVDLLIVPGTGAVRAQLGTISHVARKTCCDAIVVSVSETKPAHVQCSIGKWSPGSVNWSFGLLWISKFGEGWVIPDPQDFEESDVYFPLLAGRLRSSENPPQEALDNPIAGFTRADHFLALTGVE